jgi:hypothetical protein
LGAKYANPNKITDFTAADFTVMSLPCTTVSVMSARVGKSGLYHSVDVHHRFADIRGRHWYHSWHNGRYGWWLAGAGLAWTYYSYPWNAYCSNPAGYYPYVTQCNTTWQTVPAS